MMLPLCTKVTLFRFRRSAYSIAARTSRSVPSRDTGFTPRPVEPGNRIFLKSFGNSFSMKTRSFRTCSEPASHSMPA